MKTSARLARTFDRIRPRTRRGKMLGGLAIVMGAGALSAALFVGAAMAWNPYLEYSFNHDVNAEQWSRLKISYGDSGTCGACHGNEHIKLTSATHAKIGCQSCHGALGEHADSGVNANADQVAIRVPTNEVCLRCHTAAEGRPVGFKQIVPSQHYINECLECHDPHTGIANRPPVVRHPLDNLPQCLTCHGPEGFKARNQRHPAAASDDQKCLECHAAGRGPAEDVNSQVVTP